MPNQQIEYNPVVRTQRGPFSAAVLVGTNSAAIAWDVEDSFDRANLLGFAVKRFIIDPETGEETSSRYLQGQKRFSCDQGDHGVDVSSLQAPFQRFRWSDYAINHTQAYRYEIYPMMGAPCELVKEDPLILNFRPSNWEADDLGIYINRGVTAAFAYLNRFKNIRPKDVLDGAAYRWLSRGLKESILTIIRDAASGDKLHVAIYEFHDAEIAEALKSAHERGVNVHIVYHATDPEQKTVKESNHVIDQAGLRPHVTPRTNAKISHNKFIVWHKGGEPKVVWTGSANFTEAGFYLQTNMGLVIRDKDTARAFEEYFQVLKDDPKRERKKQGRIAAQELVEQVISNAAVSMNGEPGNLLFSPVRREHIVETAAQLVREAKSAVFLSTPFGLDKKIMEAIAANDDAIIEYGLANSTARKKVEGLKRKSTRFFTPSRLETYMGRSWDAKAFGAHKIHAKTIIVDPWSDNPKALIGSANISKASCHYNDENTILVEGNKRLSAVVATEFMRMFDHYKSRHFINKFHLNTIRAERHLDETGIWSDIYFKPGSRSHKFRDRQVFAGKG